MNEKDLLPFCYDSEIRAGLMRPWNHDGFTFASDGRVLLRIPEIKLEPWSHEPPKNFLAVFSAGRFHNCTVPIPPFPPLHREDCLYCAGSGKLEGDYECEDCDGEGKRTVPVGVMLGERLLSNLYLEKLSALQGVLFNPGGEKYSPISFTFAEGVGLLMPMRQPN